jgi:hypothetical protein
MSSPSVSSFTSNQTNTFSPPSETEQKSSIPYKAISTFLNQRLTLEGKRPGQVAQFSLAEMLSHMDIKEVTLKGSAVNQWKSKTPPADIDLQCHLESSNIQPELADKFAQFLNECSITPCPNKPDLLRRTWFSQIAYESQEAWSRLIISAGHLKPATSKIDLCYSSKAQSHYDTLSASQTIRINTAKRQANLIHKWSPSLVEWMRKNNLLWCKQDIDNGLGRLSYRLSKLPDAHLLQPHIAAEFCKSASAETIQNIYLRVLRAEYPNTQLSAHEKALLWVPVIETLQAPTTASATWAYLIDEIKNWSKFNDLNRLKIALQNPDSAEDLLKRLSNACSIGLNFKQALSELLLKHHESFKAQLQPVVHQTLGGRIIPAEQLFKIIGTFNHLENTPKQELLTIFSGYLQHQIEVGDDNILKQSKNMLGWLHGDQLASCLFWLDRLPTNARNNPSEQQVTRILQSCIDWLNMQGLVDSLEPTLPQLSFVKLKKEQIHALCNTLFRNKTQGVQFKNNSPESLCLSFIQILAQHALILTNENFYTPAQEPTTKDPILSFYKDIQKFCAQLKPQSIPPILSNVISIKNKQVFIDLPNMQLEISLSPQKVTLYTGKMRKYITNHLTAVVGPGVSSAKDELSILWNDGCLFSGSAIGKEQFEGAFSSPIQHPLPPGLKGLIELPRALCSTKWPNFCYNDHRITAKGSFSGNQLLQAKNIKEALQSLILGEIHDESTLDNSKLYQKFVNGFPVMCGIGVEDEDANISSKLQIVYDKQVHGPSLPEFINDWKLHIPETHMVRENISLFEGGSMIFNKQWNAKTRSFDGQCEILGEKEKQTFKWKGMIKKGKLQTKGELTIGNNKIPALILDSDNEETWLPISLIALLGSWFTGEMNGQYPFKSNIWNERNEWPPEEFEGFITDYSTDKHHFSGYKTTNGRAIGILTNNHDVHINRDTQSAPHYSMYIGSFITQQNTLTYEHAPLSMGHLQKDTAMPLGPTTSLLPHGLIHQALVNRASLLITHAIDWVFFRGQGLSYNNIDQKPSIRYDAPGTTRHFAGIGYKDSGKKKIIDIVINPEDQKTDFVLVRPEKFLQEPNHQSIYYDCTGLTQKILRMNNAAKMGDITFPSGVRYTGEIRENKHNIQLHGRFKISIDQLKFQGFLNENLNNPIQNLQAIDEESSLTLEAITNTYGIENLTLRDLISCVSGGQLSYDADIKPNLTLRSFTEATGNTEPTEFSLNT